MSMSLFTMLMIKKKMNMCWNKICLFQWKIIGANLLVLKKLCSNFDHNYFIKFVMTLQEPCQHLTMKREECILKDFQTEMKKSFFCLLLQLFLPCKSFCTIFEESSYHLLRQITRTLMSILPGFIWMASLLCNQTLFIQTVSEF